MVRATGRHARIAALSVLHAPAARRDYRMSTHGEALPYTQWPVSAAESDSSLVALQVENCHERIEYPKARRCLGHG